MSIVRNSVTIEGLISEEDLPKEINGQLIEFSETEYLYLSETQYSIKNLVKIELKIHAEPGRVIDAPTGKIIVLDGTKRIEVVYRRSDYYQNYSKAIFEIPFNTFIDIPNNAGELKSVDTYIVDAYFKTINSRKIYCHMLYMINVMYDIKNDKNLDKDFNHNNLGSYLIDKTVTVKTLSTGEYTDDTVYYSD